ncbi:hypothetical protein [Ralstonia sp. UBA689]|uniref:hypothetical protein n=1 Tax=Ralstonia sp. UBA689 TaxID=1947373 RepID=UPI0025E335B4|nr:hypothetical protein [Ralstonia sp. UBA689]
METPYPIGPKRTEGAKRRFLAYEHLVSLEVDTEQRERLYRDLQDARVKQATWPCTVMDASIHLERDERGGTAHLNLRASPKGVRVMRKRLTDSGDVVSQGTHVDDLGQPIDEVGKRLEMRQNYRTSLLELEAATGRNAHLMDRVNREVLSIMWALIARLRRKWRAGKAAD